MFYFYIYELYALFFSILHLQIVIFYFSHILALVLALQLDLFLAVIQGVHALWNDCD